jgi:hypothetical protein
MDYIFGSILRHKDPRLRKLISYDIICQWWKYLLERLQKLPPLVKITIILKMFRFVIPKMHIHSHTLDCQVKFSLNLVPGSGQTDGEGIERPWASIGAIASSTRVSGPGARHDILDDHWNFWNWLKTIGLRECFLFSIKIVLMRMHYSCASAPTFGRRKKGGCSAARSFRGVHTAAA